MVLDRRGFMKFLAGAGAGIMVTPVPWKLLDDAAIWTQNWSWTPRNIPGETTYAHAVSKMDPSGVPMKVRLVGNRPVRVLPMEKHPLGGGVTALSVAEVQMLHSPARVKRPLQRSPDGAFNEISWADAGKILADKLKASGTKTAFISGDETGSVNDVLSALANALGSEDMFLMPSEGQCAARAADLMGIKAQIGYDLENSDYVLAIGANILENWGTVVRNRRIFRDSRPHSYRGGDAEGPAAKMALAYAGPFQNNTAAVATPWLPIYPGTEGVLALGIANMLIAQGRMAIASDFGAFKTLAEKYTPEETAKITGVDLKKLQDVVAALLAAKAPLVIVGSESGQGNGAASIMAGLAVNALLGNMNKPGGISLLPLGKPVVQGATPKSDIYKKDLSALFLAKEKPDMLVLHEANPVYALPDPEAVAKSLREIPFKVSFSTFMDETATLCDLVLPIGMGLERIDDMDTPYGSGKSIYCISAVAVPPQYNVRTTGNILLFVARQIGLDLGYEFYENILKAKALRYDKYSYKVLAAGEAAVDEIKIDVPTLNLRPDVLAKALEDDAAGNGLMLAPFAKLSLGTAKTGIPPYNNKTLRAAELDGSVMAVMMNAATAAKQQIANGDKIMLNAGAKKTPAKVRVFEGVMNDTVAVCLGFGHTALDEFSQNKGGNVMELMTATAEPGTGLSAWAKAVVTVSKA